MFLASILAPFLVPLLPKDWRATKTLCEGKAVRFNPDFSAALRIEDHQHTPDCVWHCTGITVNHGHAPRVTSI
jgi:hypothetical protein